jgi:hypothetical protein
LSFEGFIEDNTIAFELIPVEPNVRTKIERVLFRRRFPEWWWGHFYRPEVWVFALLTIFLLVRFVRTRKKRVEGVSA